MRFSFLLISLFMAMTSLAQETQIIRIYKSSVDIDTRYVKVTISGGSFKFQLCDKLSSECIPLGKKESYTSSQLQNARDSLRLRGVIAGGADIVLVTAATGLGYPAGLFAGFFASRGSLLVANLGGGLA